MVAMAQPHGGKKKKEPKAPTFSLLELSHLQRDVRRLVPSDNWYNECIGAIHSGAVKKKDDVEKQLKKSGVFPPGPTKRDPSPVHQPMLGCKSRACSVKVRNRRTNVREKVSRKFPFYFRKGKLVPYQGFEAEGMIDGEKKTRKLSAPNLREAFFKARQLFDRVLGLETSEEAKPAIPMCMECLLALALARRERAERREARGNVDPADPAIVEPDVSGTTSSPSTEAFDELERIGGIIPQMRLPTENTEVLQNQIDRFNAGEKTSLIQ